MAEPTLDKHGAIAILIGIVGIVVTYVLWSISQKNASSIPAQAASTGQSAGTVQFPQSPQSALAAQPFNYDGPSLPSSNINYTGPTTINAPGGGLGYLRSAAPALSTAKAINDGGGCGCGGNCANKGDSCNSCDGSSLYASPAAQASASVKAIKTAQSYVNTNQASPNYNLLQITPNFSQPLIAFAGA